MNKSWMVVSLRKTHLAPTNLGTIPGVLELQNDTLTLVASYLLHSFEQDWGDDKISGKTLRKD